MARVSKELKKITDMFEEDELIDETEIEGLNIDTKFISDLEDNMLYIVDERIEGSILHSLESILLSVLFAIIAKCDKFTEIHLFMG